MSNLNFHCYIWIHFETHIQIGTNKPSIGSVVYKMAAFCHKDLKKYIYLYTKLTNCM